jgi:hypothetical protein
MDRLLEGGVVHGISAKGALLGRYPELRMLMTGREVVADSAARDG